MLIHLNYTEYQYQFTTAFAINQGIHKDYTDTKTRELLEFLTEPGRELIEARVIATGINRGNVIITKADELIAYVENYFQGN